MSPSNPTVGQQMTLEVEVRNTGTMDWCSKSYCEVSNQWWNPIKGRNH